MARAWFEDELVHTETVGQVELIHSTVERRPIHDPAFERPPTHPKVLAAMTAAPRSRAAYYLGLLGNSLLFLAGLALLGYGAFDNSMEDTWAPAGWCVIAGSFFLSMVVSSLGPSVCTCPEHREYVGCPRPEQTTFRQQLEDFGG